jgi:hypothetical protein
MSLIIPANSLSGGYTVDNSCRFDDGSSDSLSRTPGSASNRTTWTWSCWIKRANLTGTQMVLFGAKQDGSNDSGIWIETDNTLKFFNNVAATVSQIRTNRVFRDVSAWYHIVCVWDSSNATAGDRMKMYINGVEETSFQTDANPGSSDNSMINNTQLHQIGRVDSTYYFDGYMAEAVLIDGQALDPTSFGEFDEDTGIWKPISVSGLTFGTNGFYLDFEDSAALGDDVSGNGNDFTVNNLTAIDQTTDTPTNNFATLNPLNVPTSNAPTFSEGNLKSISSSDTSSRFGGSSTIGVTQGKWYIEAKATVDTVVRSSFGISGEVSTLALNNEDIHESTNSSYGYDANTGDKFVNGVQSSYGNSYTTGDIIGIALDLDNNKLYFSKNGTFQNSGDPTSGATGTGAISITDVSNTTDGAYFFTHGDNTGGTYVSTFEFNFGSPPYTISSGNADGNGYGNFEYAVPSGYLSLCTANLSEVLG